jgi:hypothetical protein
LVISIFTIRLSLQWKGLNYQWEKESFWLRKTNSQSLNHILVLGDSRIFYAINPDILKKNHHDISLNFAFPSISFTKRYLHAASTLISEKGHVFIGLTPESLTNFETDQGMTSYQKNRPLLIELGMKWLRIVWPGIDLSLLLKRGKVPLFQNPLKEGLETFHSNGWVENKSPISTDNGSMAASYHHLFKQFKIDEEIVINLEQQVKNWTKQGIKVTAFWACFDETVCKEEELPLGNGVKESINKRLEDSGAKMIAMPKETFHTFDGDHLIGSEAERFTKSLKQLDQ